jgi:hypothetical protein
LPLILLMNPLYNFFLMKRLFLVFISSLLLLPFFQACKKLNPDEPIPAYIHIEKINIKTNAPLQGSNSAKISDAWVYIDEKLIGCFELPITFPVLYEGTHQVKIRPGIKVNGIAATRAPYPFYEIFVQTIELQKNTKLNLNPVVSYLPSTKFNFMENFEGVGITLAPGPAGTADTLKQTFNKKNVFEGLGSGYAHLKKNQLNFQCVSNTSYVLPKLGLPIFLEFNYKCNHTFVAGIYAHTNTSTKEIPVIGINPTENWNKMYVYLTPTISGEGNATDFNVFFSMYNQEAEDSVWLLIDNIKLVY